MNVMINLIIRFETYGCRESHFRAYDVRVRWYGHFDIGVVVEISEVL